MQNGANVNGQKDSFNATLQAATDMRHPAMVRMFLEEGAIVDTKVEQDFSNPAGAGLVAALLERGSQEKALGWDRFNEGMDIFRSMMSNSIAKREQRDS